MDENTRQQQKRQIQQSQKPVRAATLQSIDESMRVQTSAGSVAPETLVQTLSGDEVQAGSQRPTDTIITQVGQVDAKTQVVAVQPQLTTQQLRPKTQVIASENALKKQQKNKQQSSQLVY